MRNKDQRLAFIGDYYSLFSAQCEENSLGWTMRVLSVCETHLLKKKPVSKRCDCASRSLYFLSKSRRRKNPTNKTLTPSRLQREPVELPSISRSNRTIADKPGHIQGLVLPLAVGALCDCMSVFVCVSVNTLSLKEVVKRQWTLSQQGHNVQMQNRET